MRLELTRVGLLVKLANHYTTRGDFNSQIICKTSHISKVPVLFEEFFFWFMSSREIETNQRVDILESPKKVGRLGD